ncbi:YfiR family protein [Pelagicoccus albus]|uniref:YfiR family protein n=1 Tax=Pelagicoccus albus TaxID=415222 RepID=A0A7X1E8P6_9BACT|nr:YfiR family protein [Pelagicoccus albus]MBC2606995.1 YfiR family protein [Pelagicoccus albus]
MKRFCQGIQVAMLVAALWACFAASASPVPKAKVEAAITLQLLSFTEWSDQKSGPRVIGVFESSEAMTEFQIAVESEQYIDKFEVVALSSTTPSDLIQSCDAIFFDKPQDTALPRLIRKIEGQSIVLIGTFDQFLEQGGLVNLVQNQRKLSFEINMANSKQRNIAYRAKLLKLATRIVN